MKTYRSCIILLILFFAISGVNQLSYAQDEHLESSEDEYIVFVSMRDGNEEIYLMDIDGNIIQRVTDHPSIDKNPTVYSRGVVPRIAFASNREGNYEIYAVDINGANFAKIIHKPDANDFLPSYSSQGDKIVYCSDSDRANDLELRSVGAHLSNTEGSRLTDNGVQDAYPDWSPDGSSIVFVSDRAGSSNIWRMNADLTDSEPRQLTYSGFQESYPSWSPNGRSIAFAARESNDDDWEIFVMNADGSGRHQLTDNEANDIEPTWSPSGQQIAFASDSDGDFEIYIINLLDDQVINQLTDNETDDLSPQWFQSAYCPNGRVEIGEIIEQNEALVDIRNVDIIELPNCNGNSELCITRTYTEKTTRVSSFGDVTGGGVDFGIEYEFDFGLELELSLGGKLEEYYGVIMGETLSDSFEIEMCAAPGSTVIYEIEWITTRNFGLIEVIQCGRSNFVNYEITRSLQGRVKQPVQVQCEGSN